MGAMPTPPGQPEEQTEASVNVAPDIPADRTAPEVPAPASKPPEETVERVREQIAHIPPLDQFEKKSGESGEGAWVKPPAEMPEGIEPIGALDPSNDWTPINLRPETKERIEKRLMEVVGPLFFLPTVQDLMRDLGMKDWEVEICGPNEADLPFLCSAASIVAFKITSVFGEAWLGRSLGPTTGLDEAVELIRQIGEEPLPLRTNNIHFGGAVIFLLQERKEEGQKKKDT